MKSFMLLINLTLTELEDLTCDEDGHAGQGQPGQVGVGYFGGGEAQRRRAVRYLGLQVEVNPERCGADRHGNTLIINGEKTKQKSAMTL